MNEKYFLYADEKTVVGVKFDCKNKVFTMGGLTRFRSTIEYFMVNFFDIDFDEVEERFTQRNKVRYLIPLTGSDFLAGLGRLRDAGYVTENTSNLERVMR